jgi:hypothetical protein
MSVNRKVTVPLRRSDVGHPAPKRLSRLGSCQILHEPRRELEADTPAAEAGDAPNAPRAGRALTDLKSEERDRSDSAKDHDRRSRGKPPGCDLHRPRRDRPDEPDET